MTQRFRKITPDKFKKPAPEPYRGPWVSLKALARSEPDDDFNRLDTGGTLRKADPTITSNSERTTTMSTITATRPMTKAEAQGAVIDALGLRIDSGTNDPRLREREETASLVKFASLTPQPAYKCQAGAQPAPVTKVDRAAVLAKMMADPGSYAVVNADGTLNKVATEIRIAQALGGDQRGVRAFTKIGDDAVALLAKKK